MITGALSQLHLYKSIHPNLAKAIDHVMQADFSNMTAGKYQISGEEIFFMVNEYETKSPENCEPERHKTYTDIQLMITGKERFGYTPFDQQKSSTDFLPDNDVAFYTIPQSDLNYITLTAGQFIIFFPGDIHQPEVCVDGPLPVKKVVVKVSLPGISF